MQQLTVRQINSLLMGNGLAAELPAIDDKNRAFVKVQAVDEPGYLNPNFESIAHIRFYLRKYEVPAIYLENDYDVSDDELINSVHFTNINGINQLEEKLTSYISHFSILVEEWNCDNPL